MEAMDFETKMLEMESESNYEFLLSLTMEELVELMDVRIKRMDAEMENFAMLCGGAFDVQACPMVTEEDARCDEQLLMEESLEVLKQDDEKEVAHQVFDEMPQGTGSSKVEEKKEVEDAHQVFDEIPQGIRGSMVKEKMEIGMHDHELMITKEMFEKKYGSTLEVYRRVGTKDFDSKLKVLDEKPRRSVTQFRALKQDIEVVDVTKLFEEMHEKGLGEVMICVDFGEEDDGKLEKLGALLADLNNNDSSNIVHVFPSSNAFSDVDLEVLLSIPHHFYSTHSPSTPNGIMGVIGPIWVAVYLLKSHMVVICHYEMVIWPTGIGTNWSNFEFHICEKWPWLGKNKLVALIIDFGRKYVSKLNVEKLKYVIEMRLVLVQERFELAGLIANESLDHLFELNFLYPYDYSTVPNFTTRNEENLCSSLSKWEKEAEVLSGAKWSRLLNFFEMLWHENLSELESYKEPQIITEYDLIQYLLWVGFKRQVEELITKHMELGNKSLRGVSIAETIPDLTPFYNSFKILLLVNVTNNRFRVCIGNTLNTNVANIASLATFVVVCF